jgi:hypothetical protein
MPKTVIEYEYRPFASRKDNIVFRSRSLKGLRGTAEFLGANELLGDHMVEIVREPSGPFGHPRGRVVSERVIPVSGSSRARPHLRRL